MNRTKSLAAALLAVLALAALAPSAGAAPSDTTAYLTNIRVGAHPTTDRVVLDLTSLPAYNYSFAPKLTYDPSGKPVNIPGATFMDLVMHGAAAHDDNGNLTYTGPQTILTPQLTNVQAVAIIGDFEHVLSVGLGLKHSAGVHVFTLTAPNRLVIDVDH
ncbi:hypothetical protein [Kutzneria sp. 744]|uniref:AMIN-like domain-containing (lipo)protein n=1 Tax=Kutzneria sp. (strain 744) TaxID=345341 RepID=UPI0003EEC76C|nr:hypothetical protein [Kutzneria sp. 744]EWM11761.1 hypothetical protein KUTG_02065 [Kutzneria sp. 744]